MEEILCCRCYTPFSKLSEFKEHILNKKCTKKNYTYKDMEELINKYSEKYKCEWCSHICENIQDLNSHFCDPNMSHDNLIRRMVEKYVTKEELREAATYDLITIKDFVKNCAKSEMIKRLEKPLNR